MPKTMPPGLMEFLALPNKRAKSHSTLQMTVNDGDVLRDYRFATAGLLIKGAWYEPQLKPGFKIESTLARGEDPTTVALQNVDTTLGQEFLALKESIEGAEAKIGQWWQDLDTGMSWHAIFLTGPVIGLKIDENVVQVTAISEPYARINVGASRRVASLCQWRFRDPATCGYAGSELVCNFRLNDTAGCQGRHGDPLKRAKHSGFVYLSSKSRLVAV